LRLLRLPEDRGRAQVTARLALQGDRCHLDRAPDAVQGAETDRLLHGAPLSQGDHDGQRPRGHRPALGRLGTEQRRQPARRHVLRFAERDPDHVLGGFVEIEQLLVRSIQKDRHGEIPGELAQQDQLNLALRHGR
jgi:hypothetical protein